MLIFSFLLILEIGRKMKKMFLSFISHLLLNYTNSMLKIKKNHAEMTQLIRTLVFAEYLGSTPRNHMVTHNCL